MALRRQRRASLVPAILVASLIVTVIFAAAGEQALMRLPGRVGLPPLPTNASPEQVTERYFLAQSKGDARALETLSEPVPSTSKGWCSEPIPSLRHLRYLSVRSSQADSYDAASQTLDSTSCVVSFERIHTSEIGDPPGSESLRVELRRLETSGPWVVVDFGCDV